MESATFMPAGKNVALFLFFDRELLFRPCALSIEASIKIKMKRKTGRYFS